MKFKIGDKVKNKDNSSFSNNTYIVTIEGIEGDEIHLKETGGTWVTENEIKLAYEEKTNNIDAVFFLFNYIKRMNGYIEYLEEGIIDLESIRKLKETGKITSNKEDLVELKKDLSDKFNIDIQ